MKRPLILPLCLGLLCALGAASASAQTLAWTWLKGRNTHDYYTVCAGAGVADPANRPCARIGGATWVDPNGGMWLFGGYGLYSGSSGSGYGNDLWRLDPATANWTRVKGTDRASQEGVYGEQGSPSPANTPSGRINAATWSDGQGNFWLMGGSGVTTSTNTGQLNDLWRFKPADGSWTWVGGGKKPAQAGVYDSPTTGTALMPGSRDKAMTWTDAQGRLWLFGGNGCDAAGGQGSLNDLWRYDPSSGKWTWVKGGNKRDLYGVYGVMGTAADANAPGGREDGITWIDAQGRLWLFGGWGYDSGIGWGGLNDLWRFDPATGQWTWLKGTKYRDQGGVYGVMGTAADANTPGTRLAAIRWMDGQGRLLMQGGWGRDSVSALGYMNDLWRFDPATNQWTWLGGGRSRDQLGVYGAQGAAAPGNQPGGRWEAHGWQDKAGRIWMMGGGGYDGATLEDEMNDLWRYEPATGEWAWIKGGPARGQQAIAAAMGASGGANRPGGLFCAGTCADEQGRLWLFGGSGYDARGAEGMQNDLWRFDPNSGEWTWVKGSLSANRTGRYGAAPTSATANMPGGREPAALWRDGQGRIWVFGGNGYETTSTVSGQLGDLWRFDPASGNWAWVGGSLAKNKAGVYGVQGVAAPTNQPGGRDDSASWTDKQGRFWLFGGYGSDATGGLGRLNDLWCYDPATGLWTWVKGSNRRNAAGLYDAQETTDTTRHTPGAREAATTWTDRAGNLWLFGGNGYGAAGVYGKLNDLWRFDLSTEKWFWVKGGKAVEQASAFGAQGVAAPANTPGARAYARGWTDAAGRLCLLGGRGLDGAGEYGYFNDLWRFEPRTGQWTWVAGSGALYPLGVYGSLGQSAPANYPGARNAHMVWQGSGGRVWIYGGWGMDATGGLSYLMDLWMMRDTSDVERGAWTRYQ